MSRFHILLVVIAFFLTSSCAARSSSAVARTYLEAKAIDYHRAQEARVHTVGLHLLGSMQNPPNIAFIVEAGKPEINAYSTFGKVTLTSAIVQFTKTDDELAVLLGHELAHHTQGHLTNQLVSNIFIAAAAAVMNAYVPGTGSSVSYIGQAFYNHYNQSQELTADAVGLGYAAAAGYDPRGGAVLFERMAIEVPQTLTAGFFSSHPSSPERFVAAQQRGNALLAQGYGAQPATPSVAAVAPVAATAVPTVSTVGAPPVQTFVPVSYVAPTPALPQGTQAPQWKNYNDTPAADMQLRNAEREFRAGRMSLEEFRSIKKVLQGD